MIFHIRILTEVGVTDDYATSSDAARNMLVNQAGMTNSESKKAIKDSIQIAKKCEGSTASPNAKVCITALAVAIPMMDMGRVILEKLGDFYRIRKDKRIVWNGKNPLDAREAALWAVHA